ncbi:MAG: carbohydrate kinase family protein [Candidatus Magasanikbacteria bacterium]
MSILVTGSLCYDYIMDFPGKFEDYIIEDKIHELSVSFNIDQLEKNLGGTAGNIAHTLNFLGRHPIILAPLGKDGDEYIEKLQQKGIDTTYIKQIEKEMTASAHITTDKKDNQITAFHNGALTYTDEMSIKDVEENIDFAIHSPSKPEAFVKFGKECKEKNIKFAFDPGQQITSFSEKQIKSSLKRAHIAIGNDYEIELITDQANISEKELEEQVEILIKTKGPKGSIIKTKEKKLDIEACSPRENLDPTGAGDAYRAGFIASYNSGLDLKTCGQIASTSAVYAVENYGTQEYEFDQKSFEKRFKQEYNKKLPDKLFKS